MKPNHARAYRPESIEQLVDVLRAKRRALELSIPEIADRTDVDKATIWRVESGAISDPQTQTLDSYARSVGISNFYLVPRARSPPTSHEGAHTIGNTIKLLRSHYGLSQRQVSRLITPSDPILTWQVEHGYRTPRYSTLVAFSRALRVTPIVLVPMT